MSANLDHLIGNWGSDPESNFLDNGTGVVNVSLATNESYKDKNTGEKVEHTEWQRLVVWGRQAEVMNQYTQKGSKLFIEGSLQTRKWEDKEGITRYPTEVKVRSFDFLDKKGEGPESSSEPAMASANGADDDDLDFLN